MYFLFTVDMLFFNLFFHNDDVCIFEKKTTALFNYIITRQIYRFYRVHEICDQSDLAILTSYPVINFIARACVRVCACAC